MTRLSAIRRTVMPPFGRNLILDGPGDRSRHRFSLHALKLPAPSTKKGMNKMAHHDNRPDRTRRLMLKGLFAGIGLSLTGLWQRARAAADASIWPKDAFAQKTEADTIKTLYGKDAKPPIRSSSTRRRLRRNGAVVPIAVSSALPNVTSISILVAENPNPLAASYKIHPALRRWWRTASRWRKPASDRAGRIER